MIGRAFSGKNMPLSLSMYLCVFIMANLPHKRFLQQPTVPCALIDLLSRRSLEANNLVTLLHRYDVGSTGR